MSPALRLVGGYRPDPVDPRDYPFSALRPKLSAVASGDHEIPISTQVSNQGPLSSCVGNAIADALEILLGLTGEIRQLSRLFVYWNSRHQHYGQFQDRGTHIRNAAYSLTSVGICAESEWPYEPSRVNDQPDPSAYGEARDRRPGGYYRVTGDRIDECATAIRANHPVILGMIVGTAFRDHVGDGVLDTPTDSIGGHAVILCGVRTAATGELEFKIRNSWGESWGNGGYAWMTEAALRSSRVIDVWVLTRANTLGDG